MPWYVQNFYIYNEFEISHLNNSIQHLNLSFRLSLDNVENSALNTLAEYNHKNIMNRKYLITGVRLNTPL